MKITVAATQMACGWDREENLDKAEGLIRQAAAAGANVVLPQEIFYIHFFAFMDWEPEFFAYAETAEGSVAVSRMKALARELEIVTTTAPVSYTARIPRTSTASTNG